jgi:hypothetical protein
VLIFEDLHWADEGLLDFIDGLVDRATGVPLMVLCSARPELLARRPGWGGGKPNATTLSLSTLSEEQTRQLIAAHLGESVLPQDLESALLRQADGNPLFAEEYVRMLKDRGHLRLDDGAWRLEQTDVELPDTVQGIIAARLDALTPDEKNVLQTASVVGKVFWLGSVATIAGHSAANTEERLHALERKELVRRDRHASVAGETQYAVRHVLVRDVAYAQIPRARRADLHVRAAQWIESLGEDRSEDRSEMRAHHYLAALDLMRAAGRDTSSIEPPARQAFRDAGRRAYALSALDSAARFFDRARELWPPEDREYPRLLFELGTTRFWAANEGEAELTEAAERLAASGEPEGAAEAESRLGWLTWRHGASDKARAHSARSLDLIAGLPETRATAAIRAYAWRLQVLQGDHPSLEEAERIMRITEQLGTTEDILNFKITLATGHAVIALDVAAAVRELESVVEDALRANSHLVARAYINLASFSAWLGDLRRTAELNRTGREFQRRSTGGEWGLWFDYAIAEDDFYAGEWDRSADAAKAILNKPGKDLYMDHAMMGVLTTITAARGDEPAARANRDALVARTREIGDPQVVHSAMARAARNALEVGELDSASEYLDESLEALRESLSNMGPETVEAAIVAEAMGRGQEITELVANAIGRTPWADASAAVVDGRFAEAATLLHENGDLAHAALVWLVGAERAGHRTPGLNDAIAFAERVGASAWLVRAAAIVDK